MQSVVRAGSSGSNGYSPSDGPQAKRCVHLGVCSVHSVLGIVNIFWSHPGSDGRSHPVCAFQDASQYLDIVQIKDVSRGATGPDVQSFSL